ncbi:TonB-dependent receptor domain-containing protein [Glaciecola siphonariae]|uniref:TonB-dependent receptor domain-containing protein n=1 Tax=Glaciecola siphonariae TaxID=521012 RepID=A0ABV9LV63_9ALTE
MFTNNKLAKAVKIACAFGAASTIGFTGSAISQENGAEEAVEKIQVTGSRLRQAEFASAAPIAVVGQEQFELTATVNTESLLNTLPQVVPGLDRTSNNPGNGTATVDLRGLGTNRTLVLINGTRAVPTTAGGAVDINSIPTALIKNVEVLTGGASAVYGSDAVAGVVNFILKDDFEGVEVQAGYETTEEGDAEIFNADFTIGGNFADGKGNVVFNLAYTDREDLFQGDRDFANTALFDDGNGGLEPGGSSGVPQTAIFAGGFGTFSPDSSGIIFDQNGGIRPFVTGGQVNDFYNYAPVNYIQLPQERHQATALGSYEISENSELYGRVMFTDSRVPQQLAPTPIFQTSTFTVDGNPFITPEAQQIISDAIGLGVDTDGDGIDDEGRALLRRRLEEVGPRRSEDAFTSFQFQVGIRGDIGDSPWFYDAYYQTGKVNNSTAQLGNVNRGRFDQSLLLATDDAGQVILDANGNPSCADPSANGATSGCSPLNIFGEGNISEESAAFLRTAVASTALFEQKIFGASIGGDSSDYFELPGGPIAIGFSYEHRQEDFEFLPSQDLAAGTIAGFNGAPGLEGGFTVSGFSVEMKLPILRDVEFADLLEVDLAYRTEDYSTAGSVDSYKVAGIWAPVESFRFRAGFNTAVRAPNIGELFSPRGEGFPGANDPCAGNGNLPQNDALRQLCQQTGVPANVVFSAAINPASGQVRTISGGNPNLVQEEAETLTVGIVYDVTEEFTFSLDYFDIEIDDAVAAFGGGTNNILNTCYDSSKAGSGLGGDFCNAVNRRPDGTIDFIESSSQNVASITLKGWDLIAGYDTELFGGDVSVDYIGTYTTESDFLPFDGSPDLIECAGNFGVNCGEPTPEYKHRMTFGYSTDDFSAQLLWRYVGEVDDDDLETEYTVDKIDGTHYFDLAGTYYINDNYRVTAGIDNLLDEEPPVIGDNDEQANTYPATYDVFGRTYYVSFRASF